MKDLVPEGEISEVDDWKDMVTFVVDGELFEIVARSRGKLA